MASIQRNGAKWRAQVHVLGVRDSDTFPTRQEAARWALEREAELSGKKLPDKTLGEAMVRYSRDVTPGRGGEHWERIRLAALKKYPIANRRLAALAGNDFADWRDARLAQVRPATVAREMNLLRAVLEVARRDWHWIQANPMKDVRWPETPKGRARRIAPEEERDITKAFGVDKRLVADTQTQRVGLMFLLALETAMRSGEMVAMDLPNIHLKASYVHLPETKNGDARDVALSTRAKEILKALIDALPDGEARVFRIDNKNRDALWRKVRPQKHKSVHFHDTRGEAIWRLSKKLDVLQLARMIGHRDPKSLMHYYNESATDTAKRLD